MSCPLSAQHSVDLFRKARCHDNILTARSHWRSSCAFALLFSTVLMIVLPVWITTMSLSTLKKVDSENRQFNSEWTQKYLFVFATGKPVCLLCSECISVCKEYNLRRHFKTNHANFDTTFPLGSDARHQKILGLTSCYEQSWRHILPISLLLLNQTNAISLIRWHIWPRGSLHAS